MATMIWVGAGLTVLGVIGLLASAVLALRVKGSGLDDAGVRAALQRLVALNLAALLVSALGLMAVIMGIALG